MLRRLGVYKRLFAYLNAYPRQVGIAYISMAVAALINLAIPQIIEEAIDNGVRSEQVRPLLIAGGLIMAIAVVRGLVGFGQMYYGLWLTHRVAYDLRSDFYERVTSLPLAFHDQAQTGDLMSRATSDIRETEQFIGQGLLNLVSVFLLGGGVIVAMFLESAELALLTLGPLLLLVVATIRFGNVVRPMFKRIQEQMGALSSTMQESMTGIKVVKAFAREPYEFEKFDRDNDEWFDRRFALIQTWANNWPFFTFTLLASIFLLLWFGGPRVIAGELSVGALSAMFLYVQMLNGPVQRLGFLVNRAATASASANRIFEAMDVPNVLTQQPDARVLEDVEGRVEFEHVSFAYNTHEDLAISDDDDEEEAAVEHADEEDERPVLHDINFVAEPGKTVALIGPTGSGKSTVTSLIPRFYDPIEGRVLVDGVDVREVDLHSLREHMGIVLQNPFLFSSTIGENIAYGRTDASDDEIIAAAKAARAHDFILRFPDGYDTRVGERGVTLSGGQKQRIAIARALLRNPRILILDDSTSSVDTETEHLIQQALNELMEGRTTFVIAQRLLTLKRADCILVLEDGRIVERGTHDELLQREGFYREIYDVQLRDQEEFAQEFGDAETLVGGEVAERVNGRRERVAAD